MRVRLEFEDPLPPYRCWYEVPASCSTIRDLQQSIRKGFCLSQFCKTTRLDLDGFFLLPAASLAGSIKDGDLLQVMIRRKGDSLPPRHLPVSCGKKRSNEEAELSLGSSKKPRSPTTTPCPPKQNGVSNTSNERDKKPKKVGKPWRKSTNRSSTLVNNSKREFDKIIPNQPSQRNQSKIPTFQRKKSALSNNARAVGTVSRNSGAAPSSKEDTDSSSSPSSSSSSSTSSSLSSSSDSSESDSDMENSSSDSDSSDGDSSDNDSSDNDSSSDSSDNNGSDSNGSNGDSSDSDSSDSDSSDSDTSDSDAESNSSSTMTAPQPAAKTAPRMGSRRTKARNLRRKRSAASALNPPLTEVSDTPKQKQHVASTQKNIRLPTIPLVAAPPRPTSKIIMTTVELDDSAQMSKKRKTPIPKKAARDSLKNSTNAIDIKTPTDANGNVGPLKEKMAIGLKETFDQNKDPGVSLVSAVDVSPPPNYEELAKLDGHPRVGDVVAYKLLEIGSSYMPMISDFKEATVISFSEADLEAQVLLNPRFRKVIEMDLEGRPILGKFDIYDEDTIERTQQGIAIVSWKDLVDCRVVSRK